MGAITNTSGFYVTGNDDGKKHEERHKDEQAWKMYDENVENVIELSDTQKEDDTRDLAFRKAYSLGMKDESEWAEANAKRSKKRQNKDYQEYVEKTATGVQKGLDGLTKSKDSRKRQQAHMQKSSIAANGGLAISGTLYYISSISDYEKVLAAKGEDGLKQYREFERDTLKTFRESSLYQKLHGETEVRAEIHTGEMGAQHLQMSEVLGETNSRGVFKISPVSVKESVLLDLYAEKYGDKAREMYERDIALESVVKSSIDKLRDKKGEFIVASDNVRASVLAKNPDAVEAERKNLFEKKDFNKNKQKGDLVKRLFRQIENAELERIALEKAKEHDVSWKREWGVSDGVNRTKEQYVSDMKLSEKESDVQERSKILDVRERTFSEREHALEQREKNILDKEFSVADREQNVEKKEESLKSREMKIVSDEDDLFKKRIRVNNELDKRESDVDDRESVANAKMVEANRLAVETANLQRTLKQQKEALDGRESRFEAKYDRFKHIISTLPKNTKDSIMSFVETGQGGIKDSLAELFDFAKKISNKDMLKSEKTYKERQQRQAEVQNENELEL